MGEQDRVKYHSGGLVPAWTKEGEDAYRGCGAISGPFEQQPYMNGLVVTIFGRVEPGSAQLEPLCMVGSDADENKAAKNLQKADFILRALNCHDELIDACNDLLRSFEAIREGAYSDDASLADLVTRDMEQARAILSRANARHEFTNQPAEHIEEFKRARM